MISKNLQQLLNEQVTAELWSANLYLSMSFHFERAGYSGFASWMKCQWQEELQHAHAIAQYIIKRGGVAQVEQINVVPTGWGTPLEIFQHSYEHECHVSKRINQLLAAATSENDYPTQDLLWGFVREQVEEESTLQSIVDRIKRADDSGLLFLDSQLGQRK